MYYINKCSKKMWKLYEYNYDVVRDFLFVIEIFECFVKMNRNQWIYDNIIFEEVDMNDKNEDEVGVNEEHVDCSDVFNTSHVLIWFIVIKIIKWMLIEV